ALQFFVATTRKKRDKWSRWIKLVLTKKLCAGFVCVNFTGKWMPNKLNMLHFTGFVPGSFKGKNREQQIYIAFDILQTARAPGPELRADVIDNFQTTAVQRMGQS